MIDKLTKAQKDRFPEFVEKWTKIGLSTEPGNRKVAEKSLLKLYKLANLESPEIIWCTSPFSQTMVVLIISRFETNKKRWEDVANVKEVYDYKNSELVVQATVDSVIKFLSFYDKNLKITTELEEYVKKLYFYIVQIKETLINNSEINNILLSSGYGQHDANWLSFYDYFREAVGLVDETKNIQPFVKLALNAGWWVPYEGYCFISEKHCGLNIDESGNLHCMTGAAVSYPDGWSIYASHGVRVPKYVIMEPEAITPKDIEKETNVEIRRIKIEQYGIEKYLKDSNAILMNKDEWGKLWKKEIEEDEDIIMVEVINTSPEPDDTFKTYFLRVPPEIKTAKEAVAWTFDKSANSYNPQAQT